MGIYWGPQDTIQGSVSYSLLPGVSWNVWRDRGISIVQLIGCLVDLGLRVAEFGSTILDALVMSLDSSAVRIAPAVRDVGRLIHLLIPERR